MSETEKVCACFGHFTVEITETLKASVSAEIQNAIADGVRTFLFGGRSDFDDLVYDIVTEAMGRDPSIGLKRIFCVPMEKDVRRPPHWVQAKQYEGLECPVKACEWWYKAIYYRNCAMVDMSDVILFYAEERANSGAYKTYRYARKSHKKIVNFAP